MSERCSIFEEETKGADPFFYPEEGIPEDVLAELRKENPNLAEMEEMRKRVAQNYNEYEKEEKECFNEEKHEEAVRKFFAEKEAEEKNCEL